MGAIAALARSVNAHTASSWHFLPHPQLLMLIALGEHLHLLKI
jgi:hypothetical protein